MTAYSCYYSLQVIANTPPPTLTHSQSFCAILQLGLAINGLLAITPQPFWLDRPFYQCPISSLPLISFLGSGTVCTCKSHLCSSFDVGCQSAPFSSTSFLGWRHNLLRELRIGSSTRCLLYFYCPKACFPLNFLLDQSRSCTICRTRHHLPSAVQSSSSTTSAFKAR